MNSSIIIIIIAIGFGGMELFPLTYEQARGNMVELGVGYYYTGLFEGTRIGINNDATHNLTIKYIYTDGTTKSMNIKGEKMFTTVQNGTIEVTCSNHLTEFMQIKAFKAP